MDTLFETIKANRVINNPDIKDASVKMYCTNVTKLAKMLGIEKFQENADWMGDLDQVKEKLKDAGLHYSSVRNYINSAMIFMTCFEGNEKVLIDYTEYRDHLSQMYENEQASGIWTEKQGKNAISMDDLNKVILGIGNEIKEQKLKEKAKFKGLTSTERSLMQLYMILSVHVVFPFRNDLSGMKIIKLQQYKALTDEQRKANNFLVKEKSKMSFHLNQYKTSKLYSEKVIDLPADLRRTMRFYLAVMNPFNYLLEQNSGDMMTKNALSQLLTKSFKKRTGKAVSTTLIRKIYMSERYGSMKEALEADNSNMMHSAGTALKIYVKKSAPVDPSPVE